ncbi:hypothetical protein HHK36_003144 [Tetracentron sinense]|uniref:Exocyst complex component Sec3 C-terminal domain-containing protein n=1 Tax=Tetracentron sinense TaxID=13715 RepID=A0A835DS66_TETSI|nr:hypothetical protein HHK36_003144 [Tetracentron sinense]
MSIRVDKSRGIWGKAGRFGRNMAKPRVLALSTPESPSSNKASYRCSVSDFIELKAESRELPLFATLATRIEQYFQGKSRDLVDQAYAKFVSIMFVTLEKIAQTDPIYADIVLLENYTAFQNSLYDLANVVPTLAKFYHQASESYEQACKRHINMIIYYQFERLFQFVRKIEDLMYTITPEEIPFQLGLSKTDLWKMLKLSLSGVDKSIGSMYRKLQKNLTSEELLLSLWDKCKAALWQKEFLDKYESFAQLVAKIYPNETIPSVTEMKELLASM